MRQYVISVFARDRIGIVADEMAIGMINRLDSLTNRLMRTTMAELSVTERGKLQDGCIHDP
jgi:hypothetical protein